MPVIQLPELEALAANYAERKVSLSAETQALFYCLFQFAEPLFNWRGDGYTLTNVEIDTIKAIVASAYFELMEEIPMQEKTILAPVVLYEQTLTSDNEAFFVDLSEIADYADCNVLEVYLHTRGYNTGNAALLLCYFNSDGTQSHYDNSRVVNFTSLAGQNNSSTASIAATTGSSATANLFMDTHVRIYNPHSTHIKNATSQAASTQNTTNAQTEINTLTWNDTSEIESLTFAANFSPNIGFVAGSSIRVVGYKLVNVYTP